MKDDWSKLTATHAASIILGVIHFGLGTAVLVGGEQRFPPPTYEPLIHLARGQIWIYGVMFLASGLLAMMPKQLLAMIGLGLGTIINQIFAAAFLIAVLKYSTAGATAWVAYAGYGGFDGVLLAQIYASRRRKKAVA